MNARAWVRPIPDSYCDATTGVLTDGLATIDVARARKQHGGVVAGLGWLGFDVCSIPAAHHLPDSVFVEDPAVICDGRALIARSSHATRALEADSVRAALTGAGLEVGTMVRGTLDGGDVLRVGERLYVSPSGRTNAAGIEELHGFFPDLQVVVVPLPQGVLHLKCVCSRPAPGTVLLAENTVDPALFGGFRVILTPEEELYAANTVGRSGRVLVAQGFPATRRALVRAGLEVMAVDLSEIRKGDGSLTCLSLRTEGG